MSEPRIWKTNDRVRVTLGDRTVPGVVLLASPNGYSLALEFDAMLGGYAGGMPVLWDAEAGTFRGLMCGRPVRVDEP
jgi:hypothetical protein